MVKMVNIWTEIDEIRMQKQYIKKKQGWHTTRKTSKWERRCKVTKLTMERQLFHKPKKLKCLEYIPKPVKPIRN